MGWKRVRKGTKANEAPSLPEKNRGLIGRRGLHTDAEGGES